MSSHAYAPFPMAVLPQASLVEAVKEEPDWAVLSIQDSDREEPLDIPTVGLRLSLFFDDLHKKPSPWSSAEMGYIPPSAAHSKAILSFGQTCAKERVPGLLIHCAAGISRSSAACVGLAMSFLDNPRASLFELQHSVDRAYERGWRGELSVSPNRRLTALLDAEMGCNGSLLLAVLTEYRHRLVTDVSVVYRSVLADLKSG